MKIVILEPLGVDEAKINEAEKHFKQLGHDVKYFDNRIEDEMVLAKRVGDAEVAVVTNIPLGKTFFNACPNLKFVAVAFTGYDHIDLDSCRSKGIQVANAAGFSDVAVAEQSVLLMLDVMRKQTELHISNMQLGTRNGFLGTEIYQKTIGIIGAGRIGCRTAEILNGFGCEILGHNRKGKSYSGASYIRMTSLEELIQQSDIISLHIPLTPETEHLIGEKELKMMKQNAILINTARGKVVDNIALANALNEGDIAGAGVDVYEKEPPLEMDMPLFGAPNVVLSPHTGYATHEAMVRRLYISMKNIIRWMEGNPQNIVS